MLKPVAERDGLFRLHEDLNAAAEVEREVESGRAGRVYWSRLVEVEKSATQTDKWFDALVSPEVELEPDRGNTCAVR